MQPLISVTVTVYIAATNPLMDDVVAALDHRYVYGDMPPVTLLIVTVPSFRKGQLAVVVVVLMVRATHAAQATDGWKPVAPEPSTPLISHGI